MPNIEDRVKILAEAHWTYIESLLGAHNIAPETIDIAEFHYKSAFIHGYKHRDEEELEDNICDCTKESHTDPLIQWATKLRPSGTLLGVRGRSLDSKYGINLEVSGQFQAERTREEFCSYLAYVLNEFLPYFFSTEEPKA